MRATIKGARGSGAVYRIAAQRPQPAILTNKVKWSANQGLTKYRGKMSADVVGRLKTARHQGKYLLLINGTGQGRHLWSDVSRGLCQTATKVEKIVFAFLAQDDAYVIKREAVFGKGTITYADTVNISSRCADVVIRNCKNDAVIGPIIRAILDKNYEASEHRTLRPLQTLVDLVLDRMAQELTSHVREASPGKELQVVDS